METLVVIKTGLDGLFFEVTHGLTIVTYKEVAMPENFWTEFCLGSAEAKCLQRYISSTISLRTFIILRGEDAIEKAKDLVVKAKRRRKKLLEKDKDAKERIVRETEEKLAKGSITITSEVVKKARIHAMKALEYARIILEINLIDARMELSKANAKFANADQYLEILALASNSAEDAKREIELLKRFFSLQIGHKT